MQSAIRKGIGSDVQHTHNQCAFSECELARTNVPVKNRPHKPILNRGSVDLRFQKAQFRTLRISARHVGAAASNTFPSLFRSSWDWSGDDRETHRVRSKVGDISHL